MGADGKEVACGRQAMQVYNPWTNHTVTLLLAFKDQITRVLFLTQSPEFTCWSAKLDSAIFRGKIVPTTVPFSMLHPLTLQPTFPECK